MAPERFRHGAIDRRTDVYSLACLLYECLTGKPPFAGDGPTLMYAHLNIAAPRPSAAVPGLARALDEVVSRGMAKAREDRYLRAGDLAAAARRALRTAPTSKAVAHDRLSDNSTVVIATAADRPRPGAAPQAQQGHAPVRRPPPGSPGEGRRPQIETASAAPWLTNGRAALIVALVAVLVTAVTIGALQLVGPDARTGTAISGTASSTTVTSPAAQTQTPPIPPPNQQALLDRIPLDFAQTPCLETIAFGDGDLAAVTCGASQTQPGPSDSTFYLYPGSFSLQASFEQRMSGLGRPQLFGDAVTDCVPEVGYLFYAFNETETGYVTCYVDEGDYAIIEWTDNENALYGVVSTLGGVDALPLLFEWWVLNS